MELSGDYLFNLSVIGISFSAVSTLVTILRQSLGGKLTAFDIFLLTTYISDGFIITICSLLPALLSSSGLSLPWTCSLASLIAAALLAGQMVRILSMRTKATKAPMSFAMQVANFMHGLAIALMLLNAVIPAFRGLFLFQVSMTLYVASAMWIFSRRIATLNPEEANEDWDPKRG